MNDVSATGMKATLFALPTFPAGFDIVQFSDDSDPVASDAVDIASAAAALNGDMVSWSLPNIIPARIGVMPNTEEDKNLGILWAVNRTGKNKLSAQDIITLVITYPSGKVTTLSNGRLISGPGLDSGSSSGRLQTKVYNFAFESIV